MPRRHLDHIRHVPAAVLTHTVNGRRAGGQTRRAVNPSGSSRPETSVAILHRILATTAGADGGLGTVLSDIGTIVPARYLLGCGTSHLILGFTPR